jgi:predicted membrane protein
MEIKSQSWHLAKIGLVVSIVSFIVGIPLYVVFIGTGGEPGVFLTAILLFSLVISAVFSSPIYLISFRKNKNWLNITGLILNVLIICLAIILLIFNMISNINYDRQAKREEEQFELEHSQWINSVFNESESKLESYYNINKKYPVNFCDANNDSNLSCGELDVNDNDTQQNVDFNDTEITWKSLYYIVSEQGQKYELCANFSESCVSKTKNERK